MKLSFYGLFVVLILAAQNTVAMESMVDECAAYNQEGLVHVEGILKEHHSNPAMACDCLFKPGTEKTIIEACRKGCENTPVTYWFIITNDKLDITSKEGTIPVIFSVLPAKASLLDKQIVNGKKFGVCGIQKLPEKGKANMFAIPVIEGILESLKELDYENSDRESPSFVSNDTEGTQRCEAISSANNKYLYGEARLIHFTELFPPADSPTRREQPRSYGASFLSPKYGEIKVYIRGEWKDLSVSEPKLELAPLPISMNPGKHYGFCYQQRAIKGSKKIHTFIDYPQTIKLIGE